MKRYCLLLVFLLAGVSLRAQIVGDVAVTRKVLAEIVGIEWRYLANIENKGTIPSLPVVIQLIKVCGLPVEQYFNPEIIRGDSEQRQRVSHKLKLCPEHYLPVIEGAIDGALKIEQSAKETGDV